MLSSCFRSENNGILDVKFSLASEDDVMEIIVARGNMTVPTFEKHKLTSLSDETIEIDLDELNKQVRTLFNDLIP